MGLRRKMDFLRTRLRDNYNKPFMIKSRLLFFPHYGALRTKKPTPGTPEQTRRPGESQKLGVPLETKTPASRPEAVRQIVSSEPGTTPAPKPVQKTRPRKVKAKKAPREPRAIRKLKGQIEKLRTQYNETPERKTDKRFELDQKISRLVTKLRKLEKKRR
tara:strand:- start:782 stop:1261 length:480 start_codon:yes stop_codon:yes gene_type:complete